MKPAAADRCTVHVLVCTNQRPPGRTGCHDFGGQQMYSRLKERVKAEGLASTHWVTRTGCLGFCNTVGTTVAVYRRGAPPIWMNEVTATDFDSVWEQIVRQ